MATPAQAAANLANAQYSTGPKTDAGKKKSSRNALTHGLFSATVVLPEESQAEFEAFRLEIFADLVPATLVEATFVDDIAANLWRVRRMQRLERQAMDIADPDFHRLRLLSSYTSRVRRDIATALRSLHQIQDHRQKCQDNQLSAAIFIRKADLAANRPTDLFQLGFDLPLEIVDRHIRLDEAIVEAQIVRKKAA
jgi:hypothetical protein